MVRSEHVRTLFDSTESQEAKSEVLSISTISDLSCAEELVIANVIARRVLEQIWSFSGHWIIETILYSDIRYSTNCHILEDLSDQRRSEDGGGRLT